MRCENSSGSVLEETGVKRDLTFLFFFFFLVEGKEGGFSRDVAFFRERARESLKEQVYVYLFVFFLFATAAITKPGNAPFNLAYKSPHTPPPPQDRKLHETCSHVKCRSDQAAYAAASEVGHLYSYCIWNYQDSGC